MALPSSGNPLSIAQIQGEFGGTNPARLSEYYSAHSSVPSTGNPISISDFYGLSDVVTFTYALIGGGGGGGHGFDGGANGVTADSGGTSHISGSGFSTVSASGGSGGRSGYFHPGTDTTEKDGDASVYGAGGGRGPNTDPGPVTMLLHHLTAQVAVVAVATYPTISLIAQGLQVKAAAHQPE